MMPTDRPMSEYESALFSAIVALGLRQLPTNLIKMRPETVQEPLRVCHREAKADNHSHTSLSRKFFAVFTAPAAIKSSLLNEVSRPMVERPAAQAEVMPETGSSNATASPAGIPNDCNAVR